MEHHRDKISHPAMMVPTTTTTTTGSTATARGFRPPPPRGVAALAVGGLCVALFVVCVALGKGAETLEAMAVAATGRDESVVEYNSDLAKAHGTDAPGIFSGGGLVDKAKEFNEGTWARLRSVVLRQGREKIVGDDEESIDGLSVVVGGQTTKNKNKNKNTRQDEDSEDFDEEEESTTNADDPSLLKVVLPKSYEKALRRDIEKMLQKMPKFTNVTLRLSGCLRGDDAYSRDSDSFGDGGVSSAKVPELEIFPNANVRSWPG